MNFSAQEVTNFDGIAEMAYRWPHNTLSLQAIKDMLIEDFLFGYEIFQDGIHIGYAYALFNNDRYTLDGYNEGGSVWAGVYGGRIVLERLFAEYTNKVWTVHQCGLKALDALVKRLGFKFVREALGRNIFVKEIS